MFWGRQPGHPPATAHGASCGAEPAHSSVPASESPSHPIPCPSPGSQHALLPSSCRVSPGSPRPRQSGGGRSRGWRLSLPSAPRGFGDGWRLQLRAPPGPGDPARAGGRRLGSGWQPRGMLSGKSPCRNPTQLPAHAAHCGAWLYLAPHRWWRSRSWKWPSASSAGRNTASSGAEGQGSGRESWGHARTWGLLGPR